MSLLPTREDKARMRGFSDAVKDFSVVLDSLKARIESLESEKKNLTSYAAVLKKREGELEKENAALREAQRWIPVTERLPAFGERVLTWEGERAKHCFDVANSVLSFMATHWMPLPPPPEEQK